MPHKAIRNFLYKGEAIEEGTIIEDMPEADAKFLTNIGRVVAVEDIDAEAPSLEGMTKQQLLDMAAAKGLTDVKPTMNKAEIIEAINMAV